MRWQGKWQCASLNDRHWRRRWVAEKAKPGLAQGRRLRAALVTKTVITHSVHPPWFMEWDRNSLTEGTAPPPITQKHWPMSWAAVRCWRGTLGLLNFSTKALLSPSLLLPLPITLFCLSDETFYLSVRRNETAQWALRYTASRSKDREQLVSQRKE